MEAVAGALDDTATESVDRGAQHLVVARSNRSIAAGCRSQSAVDPSRSVNRNVRNSGATATPASPVGESQAAEESRVKSVRQTASKLKPGWVPVESMPRNPPSTQSASPVT